MSENTEAKPVYLTPEQTQTIIECLEFFASEAEFSKEKRPSQREINDFAIYMMEAIEGSNMEIIRNTLEALKALWAPK